MRNVFSHRLWMATAVTAMVGLTAGCSGSAIGGGEGGGDGGDGPVRIGLTTALTGAYSEFGVPMENSIRLAIEEFNEAGVCDQEVELIAYDDQLVAETAQTNMRRLLGEDAVDFIMAPAGSGPTLAVLPLVNAENLLMMNSIAQTSEIVAPDGRLDEPYDNVFSFSLMNVVEAEFMGQYLSDNFDTVALIVESTPYGETGLVEIERILGEAGVDVVARERYDQGATDVTAQLARIQQATPGAVAMVGLGADTATIRQGMARLNMLEIPFVISNGAGTIPYQERAGELVDGTIVVQYKAFAGHEPETESARDFAQKYLGAYGNDRYYGEGDWPVPSFGSTPASSYDGAKVLLNAFERAGCNPATELVVEQLESGDGFEAARGEYAFSDTDHVAVTPDFLTAMVYRVGADGSITYEPAEG